jgi:crotonobetainyl-CoA:carnitine CoA-transferase CaiB-like acyl-CoA transferase
LIGRKAGAIRCEAVRRYAKVGVDLRPGGGPRALGYPLHFSATPTVEPKAAPALGQHSREVLRECGYAAEEIRDLVAAGAVA